MQGARDPGEEPTAVVGESPTTVVTGSAQVVLSAGESPTTSFAGEHGTAVYPAAYAQVAPAVGTDLVPVADARPPAVAQPAGWYPDPWSAGAAGKVRYWDGLGWTGYAADAAGAAMRPNLGVPGWLLGMWAVVALAISAAIFPVVLVMGAFACDSGWEGCSEASANAIASYAVVAAVSSVAPAVLAVVIARGRRLGRVLRIVALVLIPLAPVVGVVTAFAMISAAFPE